MEKDIDDLLDEVETKFVNNYNPKKSAASATLSPEKQTSKPRTKKAPGKQGSALDDVIDDILDIDLNEGKQNCEQEHQPRLPVLDETCKSDPTKRCFPVFLGGSADSMGRSSAASRRACDQLRCTSCDFKVCSFDNLSWHMDTDYLFLRNNVPNVHKLKTMLHRKKGMGTQ